MNASLSILGTAMLVLIGLAVVLAVIILILYEARWILCLTKELLRPTATVDGAGARPEPLQDNGGGA